MCFLCACNNMVVAILYAKYSVITIIIILLVAVVCYALFTKLYYSKKDRQKQSAQVKALFEQTVLLSQLEIQEQTLRHISQEIHDNIGQVLSLAKLNLSTAGEKFVPEKIMLSEELLGKAIADLRDVSKSLFNEINADRGLVEAIQNELKMIENITSLHTKFIMPADDPMLKKGHAIILFRIIQEILNNIIKHAKATEITLVITEELQRLSITITDNGRVSDKEKREDSAEIELKNIKDRAKIIDAAMKVNSQTGKGTIVMIEIPLNENI
jgi:signal transduction histidine kinase